MLTHLLYHKSGSRSATRLAAYMGILAALEFDSNKKRPDWLIRWGTPLPVPLAPDIGVLNGQAPLTRQQHRVKHIETIRAGGVPAPGVWGLDKQHLIPGGIALLGRSLIAKGDTQTTKGQGITFYPAGMIPKKHDFFVEFIPKEHEFRVDVIAHKTRVRQLTPADPTAVAWNTAGVYDAPYAPVPLSLQPLAVAAVKALGLDFGAVDCIVDKDGKVYVLEVNTAPELSNNTLEWYADQFAWLTGMDADAMPGWDAVKKLEAQS